MNFVYISPQFPRTYWNFCDRLHKSGVNVLGIGDASFDTLEEELKDALTEYYRVDSMEDYDQVFRAVAYFSFKYGKIDWIESNNEYWLAQDAQLRTDFNIRTGVQADEVSHFRSKSEMKLYFRIANVPTPRQIKVTNLWPNRLIGDAKKPADCVWSSQNRYRKPFPKGWPDWLLEGKPSPTGRRTFATAELWTAAEEPLPSGLLGPVKLVFR